MLENRVLNRIYMAVTITVPVLYFLSIMIPWLGNNLWSDEFYTLKWFSLVPLKTVVADYHSTNHILYDLFNYCYLKILGIDSLAYLLERPWILRLPLLLLALVSLLLMYRTAALIGGRMAGIAAVALLATDIPFQNYCIQIRGYGFTVFFDLLLIYCCLHYARYGRRVGLIGIAVAGFAAMYSVLSNLYSLIGAMAFWAFEPVYIWIKERGVLTIYWKPILALSLGLGLALLCYSPVFKDAFTNHYVNPKSASFHLSNVYEATFVYAEIIHGRIPLYFVFLACALIYFTPVVAGRKAISTAWRLVGWQFVVPVVIVMGVGQHPPARIFIHLCVFADLLIATTVIYVLGILLPRVYTATGVGLMCLYLIWACQKEKAEIRVMMSPYVIQPKIHQDLRANYCLYYYEPLRVCNYIAEQYQRSVPTVLQRSAYMHCYLETLHVPYYLPDSIDHLLTMHKKILLSTVYPVEIDSVFMALHHCSARELMPPSFDHLFELEAR
jgi:hypothetical protein